MIRTRRLPHSGHSIRSSNRRTGNEAPRVHTRVGTSSCRAHRHSRMDRSPSRRPNAHRTTRRHPARHASSSVSTIRRQCGVELVDRFKVTDRNAHENHGWGFETNRSVEALPAAPLHDRTHDADRTHEPGMSTRHGRVRLEPDARTFLDHHQPHFCSLYVLVAWQCRSSFGRLEAVPRVIRNLCSLDPRVIDRAACCMPGHRLAGSAYGGGLGD